MRPRPPSRRRKRRGQTLPRSASSGGSSCSRTGPRRRGRPCGRSERRARCASGAAVYTSFLKRSADSPESTVTSDFRFHQSRKSAAPRSLPRDSTNSEASIADMRRCVRHFLPVSSTLQAEALGEGAYSALVQAFGGGADGEALADFYLLSRLVLRARLRTRTAGECGLPKTGGQRYHA